MLIEHCQKILEGRGMPEEWAISVDGTLPENTTRKRNA